MEIVLNFEKKELVVKQASNIKELYKRLKRLLGEDLDSWTMVSDGVSWYYPIYPTYPWPVTWDGTSTGDPVPKPSTTIYCLSDQAQPWNTTAEFVIDGDQLVGVLKRGSENSQPT
jgi:hypothetical protein